MECCSRLIGLLVWATLATQVAAQPLPPLFRRAIDATSDDPVAIPLWKGTIPNQRAELGTRQTKNRGAEKKVYQRWISGITVPQLTIHPAAPTHEPRPAVIICPGGGYYGLAIDKEGHDTARWLNSLGITGLVLEYRTAPFHVGAPKQDVQEAIRVARVRATEWHIDPNRLGVLGYSAGGHLASTAGTHFGDNESLRPDFMILIYPVVSLEASITHQGSRNNIIGRNPSPELVHEYSNERHVTDRTPPTFIVHAKDDKSVPWEHSRRLIAALQAFGTAATLDVYKTGGHGFGLGVHGGEVTAWPNNCAKWLESIKIIAPQDADMTQ